VDPAGNPRHQEQKVPADPSSAQGAMSHWHSGCINVEQLRGQPLAGVFE